jgi:D-alanyl-D-alanine carboxypeptidase
MACAPLGTVERPVPVNAAPPNLREEMCGKKRKRPGAESEDDDDSATSAHVDSGSPYAINLSNLRGSVAKPSSLLGPYNPSIDPIVVFTGPPKNKKSDEPLVAARPGKAGPPIQLQRPQTTAPAFAANPPAYPSTSAFTPTRGALDNASVAIPLPKPRPAIATAKSGVQASAAAKPKSAGKKTKGQ